MPRPRRIVVAALVMIATGLAPAAAADPTSSVVGIHLVNRVYLHPEAMATVTSAVERIFERAGVRLAWLEAQEPPPGLCLIVIVAAEPPDEIFVQRDHLGFALVGAEGTSRVAYALMNRIRRMSSLTDQDLSTVLAYVIAHELGHLLLPGGAHVPRSIMQERWDRSTLRRAALGRVLFTPEQSGQMRDHIAAHHAALALKTH